MLRNPDVRSFKSLVNSTLSARCERLSLSPKKRSHLAFRTLLSLPWHVILHLDVGELCGWSFGALAEAREWEVWRSEGRAGAKDDLGHLEETSATSFFLGRWVRFSMRTSSRTRFLSSPVPLPDCSIRACLSSSLMGLLCRSGSVCMFNRRQMQNYMHNMESKFICYNVNFAALDFIWLFLFFLSSCEATLHGEPFDVTW